jgi:hypothetical protein
MTKDTSTIPLGLAQIRVGASAANIASATAVLLAAASIGALANTKFTGNVDYWKLESGFPLLEDLSIPIREAASLECAFKELTPYNLALARGIDPAGAISAAEALLDKVTAAGTTDVAKSIAVDDDPGPADDVWTVVFLTATTYKVYGQDTGHVQDGVVDGDTTLIFEPENGAVYTYPNQTNHMYVIFPRANVTSSVEVDWASEDTIASPLTFEGKRADEDVAGGNAAWNSAPIGIIIFD